MKIKILILAAAAVLCTACGATFKWKEPCDNQKMEWYVCNATDVDATIGSCSVASGERVLYDEHAMIEACFDVLWLHGPYPSSEISVEMCVDGTVVKTWYCNMRFRPGREFFDETDWAYESYDKGEDTYHCWTFTILPEDME